MAMSDRERAEREVSRALSELAITIREQANAATVRAEAQHRVAVAAGALLQLCDGYDRETMTHYARLAEQEGRICERMAEVHAAEAARAEAQAQSRATKADRFQQEHRLQNQVDAPPRTRAKPRRNKRRRAASVRPTR